MQDTLHLFIQVVRLTFFDRFMIKTGSTQSTRRTRLSPSEDKLGGKNQNARASAHVIKLIRKYITAIALYCMCAAQKTGLSRGRKAYASFMAAKTLSRPWTNQYLRNFSNFYSFLKTTNHFRIAIHLFGNRSVSFLSG